VTRRGAGLAGLALASAVSLGACGGGSHGAATAAVPARLAAESRPLGAQARFHPPASAAAVPQCRGELGPRVAAHVELFAENRVVVIPAGVGTQGPRRLFAGRVVGARCFGQLVTLEPTGVVLVRPGRKVPLADLFRSWGLRLTSRKLAGFRGRVRVYVDGRERSADPRSVTLTRHAEIVLEVGPHVPPHRQFLFPPPY
jgi:hypothetical protein